MGYLNDWEKCVNEREGFSKSEKKRMLLSVETRGGLRLMGMSTNNFGLNYTCITV